ncbi:hypothetical protein D3C81_2095010 [compost metagenome]
MLNSGVDQEVSRLPAVNALPVGDVVIVLQTQSTPVTELLIKFLKAGDVLCQRFECDLARSLDQVADSLSF